MFQGHLAADKIRLDIGVFLRVIILYKSNPAVLWAAFWSAGFVSEVEADPAIVAGPADQVKEFSLPAADFEDRFFFQAVLGHQGLDQPLMVGVEDGRKGLGRIVPVRIFQFGWVKQQVRDESALVA